MFGDASELQPKMLLILKKNSCRASFHCKDKSFFYYKK